MNGPLVLLFSSPPDSERLKYGVEVARRSSEQGNDVVIVLMQDSVLLALKDSSSSQILDNVPKIYALDEHLKRRGHSAESLRPGIQTIGYEELVELVMSDSASVIGSL